MTLLSLWKLATDENFNGRILRGLLRRLPALDVVRLQDTLPEGTEDETVLDWAADKGRVILSHDFSTLIGYAYQRLETGRKMLGLIVVQSDCPIGLAISDLHLLYVASEPAEIENQILDLPF